MPSSKKNSLQKETISWRENFTMEDIERVRELTRKAKVFSPEEIQVAGELMESYLQEGHASGYHFLFAEEQQKLLAYTCYGPIPLTHLRFDLYWIVVHPKVQQKGLGRLILQVTEYKVREFGARQLYAETSGRNDYIKANFFYQRNGFSKAAEIKDFYRDGDPKVIYKKIFV